MECMCRMLMSHHGLLEKVQHVLYSSLLRLSTKHTADSATAQADKLSMIELKVTCSKHVFAGECALEDAHVVSLSERQSEHGETVDDLQIVQWHTHCRSTRRDDDLPYHL
jgi:hypothetical protein